MTPRPWMPSSSTYYAGPPFEFLRAAADRETAEDGIRLAYQSAGLAAPVRIIWCGGPIEIAQQLASATAGDQIGSNVKAQIFDTPRQRVGMFAEIFWKEIIIAASELGHKRIGINAARNSLDRATQTSRAINRSRARCNK